MGVTTLQSKINLHCCSEAWADSLAVCPVKRQPPFLDDFSQLRVGKAIGKAYGLWALVSSLYHIISYVYIYIYTYIYIHVGDHCKSWKVGDAPDDMRISAAWRN